jgi:aerobic carbon-monoxide dehydrogenase medium subunit
VKPAPFEYLRARTPEEAVELLAGAGDGARVLAGGQSLVLDMNLRRVRPTRLVDINPISDLDLLTVEGDSLRIGALVRHKTFEEPVVAGPLGGMLALACGHIAHPPIRARGTMVGSLAYAHPSAEWGAVALDAELDLLGPGARAPWGPPASSAVPSPRPASRTSC